MSMLALVLSTLAFMHFALCIDGHGKKIKGCPPSRPEFWSLQLMAWTFLLASLYPCLLEWGGEIGVTTWLGLITLSALLVAALMNYFPALFRRLWRCCPGALIEGLLQRF